MSAPQSPPLPGPAGEPPGAFRPPRPAVPAGPERLGRYVVQGLLGQGGMGAVYRGFDPSLARPVAIKVLLDPRARSSGRERLLREARATARLQHPGIVAVHEVGEEAGAPYLVMDLVAGAPLEDALEHGLPGAGSSEGRTGGPVAPRRLAAIVREVALALAHAHERGVIHRDVKPSNVLIERDGGRARLVDFGLARALQADGDLTVSGQIVGTPQYMAPEQVHGGRDAVGPLADVYGLGGLLYWGLVGRPPADGETVIEVVRKVIAVDPVPPRRIDARLHPDLETIALTCLEKDPARRYPGAAEVAAELERFLGGEAIVARPLGRVGAARRWLARNRLLGAALIAAAALAVATVTVTAGGAIVLRQRVAAERARFLEQARRRAAERSAAFASARAEAPPADETPEQGRARRDRLLALGLEALGASSSLRSLAPSDERARRQAFEVAVAVGELALESEQWSVAASAFDQAVELGVDRAGARRRRDEVESARERVAREHRRAVESVLERARTGALFDVPGGLEDGVYELVRYPEAQTIALLRDELASIAGGLRASARDTLLEAVAPEARTESLVAAVDRWSRLPLDEDLDRASYEVFSVAMTALLERATARRAPDARVPTLGPLIAAAQERAVGRERLRTARLCAEALGRIGVRQGAVEALADYLAAEWDQTRAVPAGLALCRIGGEEAERVLLEARDRYRTDGTFWRQISRLFERTGVDTPLRAETSSGYLDRGIGRLAKNDVEGAIADFDRAIELDPTDGAAHTNRGFARQALGEHRLALADFDRAIELGFIDARAFMNRGISRARLGEVEGAIADLDRAIELDPDSAVAFANRGRTHQLRGDLRAALADFDRAVELDPEDGRAFNNRSDARLGVGDPAGAFADADHAIALDPGVSMYWVSRGRARFAQGDLAGARADFDRALTIDARSVPALVSRGGVRVKLGDLDGAIADLDRAIELAPDRPDAYYNRAMARAVAGDTDGAMADYGRTIERDPRYMQAHHNRGRMRLMRGDVDGGLADLDRAVALAPGFAPALINRGIARRQRGDLDGSLADLDRAVELAPHELSAHHARGNTHQTRGELEAAIADYGRALEIDPRCAAAWHDRAGARAAMGDSAGAIADLERFLQLVPAGPQADAARRRLDELRTSRR